MVSLQFGASLVAARRVAERECVRAKRPARSVFPGVQSASMPTRNWAFGVVGSECASRSAAEGGVRTDSLFADPVEMEDIATLLPIWNDEHGTAQ